MLEPSLSIGEHSKVFAEYFFTLIISFVCESLGYT